MENVVMTGRIVYKISITKKINSTKNLVGLGQDQTYQKAGPKELKQDEAIGMQTQKIRD